MLLAELSDLADLTPDMEHLAKLVALRCTDGSAHEDAISIFTLLPDSQRDELARRAVALGGNPQGVALSLKLAREKTSLPAQYKTKRTYYIAAGVGAAALLIGIGVAVLSRRKRR